jgi:hypothetical protein
MKKIIDELINSSISGVDVYRYKNATWLIFTDEVRWVVELTDEGTLWYNYNFFSDIFKYVSLECGGESNDYIIGWANDYFFKDIKKARIGDDGDGEWVADIVINEGVKNIGMGVPGERVANIVINEGVMEAKERGKNHGNEFEWHTRAVMNHGIKEIKANMLIDPYVVNVIEDGIKNIYPDKIPHDYDWSDEFDANKVIDGGVKV